KISAPEICPTTAIPVGQRLSDIWYVRSNQRGITTTTMNGSSITASRWRRMVSSLTPRALETLGLGRRGPAIPTEWISKQGFGMQGANPVTVAAHPRRRIGRLDRERLSFHGQSLFDFVGDDCDVLAQHAHLHLA